ncbi:NADH-quinone oxidoreductase subunit N [Rhodobacter sp. Har01]|uniref:NADH-quinone oxidoreductase subunit N n=1 Tax=Rhodobacter sp. Har01 TaxID=2883999 RepID=UPI001D091720|nr:proton-conducting transporter membrane subunit [Rhodobacter sp. Har01]MCB6179931.1 NADH-quinone oxidoreductase subunit N [Rhodobacter sp. Har01]
MQGLGLAPFAALGLTAVVTMVLSARAPDAIIRGLAGLGLVAALILSVGSTGTPPPDLLAGDALARFGSALACLSGLAALAILRPETAPPEAPALVLLATLGAAVLSGATHAATLFTGIELVTLALIALAVLPRSGAALEAGYKLLVLGGLGAATLLMGLALGFAQTGDLGLSAWAAQGPLATLGAAFLLAGLAFKFALVPFHMWTPDVFAGAPAAASVVAGVASKVAVAIVLVRLNGVMPPDGIWAPGLALLGTASVLLGNLQALRQPSLARMLGFSSIAHSGYVALILATPTATASAAAIFYLAATAPALIAALAVAVLAEGAASLTGLRGLAWSRPLAGTALAVALLSLAGLPAAVGFWAKLQLFTALARADSPGLLAVAIVGSALGLYFYLGFTLALFRRDSLAPVRPPRAAETAVLAAAAATVLGLGVLPSVLLSPVLASLP